MRKARLLAVGAVLTLVGCGGGGGDDGGGGTGPAVFTALNVTPTSVTVAPNGTQALTASAVDQRGQGMTGLVTQFSSSNQSTATVTNGGVVTGVAMDHAAILGDTLDKIALEKAGIFRLKQKVVIGASGDPAAVPAARPPQWTKAGRRRLPPASTSRRISSATSTVRGSSARSSSSRSPGTNPTTLPV